MLQKVGEHRSQDGLFIIFFIIVGSLLIHRVYLLYQRRALLLFKGLYAWAVNKSQSRPAIIWTETFFLPLWPTCLLRCTVLLIFTEALDEASVLQTETDRITGLSSQCTLWEREPGVNPRTKHVHWPGAHVHSQADTANAALHLLGDADLGHLYFKFVPHVQGSESHLSIVTLFTWRDHCSLIMIIMFNAFIFSFLHRLCDGQSPE